MALIVAALVGMCCALALAGPTATAAELDVRLRIVWGHGEPHSWQGTIRVSSGSLGDPIPLGLEPDSPGSMLLVDSQSLQVFPRVPRNFDGVDLRVQAPLDAKLIVSLTAADAEPLDPIELPIGRILEEIQRVDLDDRQNVLLAQRSPGDALRVTLVRDSLVFAPGDKLECQVQPLAIDLEPNTTYLLEAVLSPDRSDERLWSEDRELKTDAEGVAPRTSFAATLPAEGVFEFKLALYPKRLTTSLVRGKPLVKRSVQCVAVAPLRPIERTVIPWQSAYELDPANPSWWERMARMPSLRRIPNLGPQQLQSGPTKNKNRLGRPWIELAPGGWQAYPLAIDNPGQPHLLEVEYPSDFAQTLGISLIEPCAGGQVQPIGLDSGFEVKPPAAGHKPELKQHKLAFWPRTKTPWVLVTNRREDGPALVGRMNVLRGPEQLPALPIPTTGAGGRTLAAYLDKPLVAENFSADEAVDPATGRSFDDWRTFFLAGERMVSALEYAGFNAVVLNVASEGSTLYPSKLLDPTPKHDTGIFFESGQDPVRKDVLELLLRLCDRAGIRVLPAVQFATPLPELEAIRLAGGTDAIGIEPLGPDGNSWVARKGTRRGQGVYYNALDPRVQAAMRSVVGELTERYGRHASFGGIAVQWSAESFAILPDETWSCDDATFAAFLSASELSVPGGANAALAARRDLLAGAGSDAWLAWRTQRLAEFYRQMHAEIEAVRPGAKLLLAPADLLSSRRIQQSLRPTLPAESLAARELRSMGIDPALVADVPGILLPRPYGVAAGAPPLRQSLVANLNQLSELDDLFASRVGAPALHFHEPASLALPQFDKVSPFGPDKTHTWLVSQLSPAADLNRQRLVHSLARHDSTLLIDGGWLLPLGQEEPLRPLVKVFRRLPAEPFVTAPAKGDKSGQGIVVRTLAAKNKTYFYAANDTPWPARLEIDFAAAPGVRIVSYAEERPATLDEIPGGTSWSVALQPFDLVGGELDRPRATVADYRVMFVGDPAESISARLRDLSHRVNTLTEPPARNWLANPSFETPREKEQIPGWVHGAVPAGSPHAGVTVDPSIGYPQGRSLRITSRSGAMGGMMDPAAPVVWVRSEPIAVPTTGRLAVVAWIRSGIPTQQPQLRLAIEGKQDGRVHYQFVQIGRDNAGQPTRLALGADWTRCQLLLTNFPLDGITDLRVGFDLMSEGDVWIDDVKVYDTLFEESERDELLKSIHTTRSVQLGAGRLGECQRFLDGYWPNFLLRHVPAPPARSASAGAPTKTTSPAEDAAEKKPAEAASRTTWDKMKSWLPKSWR
jgi:hypothetical protein